MFQWRALVPEMPTFLYIISRNLKANQSLLCAIETLKLLLSSKHNTKSSWVFYFMMWYDMAVVNCVVIICVQPTVRKRCLKWFIIPVSPLRYISKGSTETLYIVCIFLLVSSFSCNTLLRFWYVKFIID